MSPREETTAREQLECFTFSFVHGPTWNSDPQYSRGAAFFRLNAYDGMTCEQPAGVTAWLAPAPAAAAAISRTPASCLLPVPALRTAATPTEPRPTPAACIRKLSLSWLPVLLLALPLALRACR